jgi:hypothetical protein
MLKDVKNINYVPTHLATAKCKSLHIPIQRCNKQYFQAVKMLSGGTINFLIL